MSIKKEIECIIPEDRPVTGADIVRLQEAKDQTLMDTTWENGWYNSRYNEQTNVLDLQNQPLTSITRALLVRAYANGLTKKIIIKQPDSLPSYGLLPTSPTFDQFHKKVAQSIESTPKDHLPPSVHAGLKPVHTAALMGMNGNSATRWIREDSTPNPAAQRLMTYVYSDMESRGVVALFEFLRLVNIEAKARGLPKGLYDVLDTGKWAGTGRSRRGRPSKQESLDSVPKKTKAKRKPKA